MLKSLTTIPNLLSTARLLLIPVLWVFAAQDMPVVVAVGTVIAALTDTLDGVIASIIYHTGTNKVPWENQEPIPSPKPTPLR